MASPKRQQVLDRPGDASTNGAMLQDLAARLAEFNNLPIIREDDPETDMGEANLHAISEHILRYAIEAHLADRPKFRVFSNLNLYYLPKFKNIYVSPDVMVTTPDDPSKEDVKSYRIGRDGPEPLQVTEVLSEETWQEGDLELKLYIYAMIGVNEYIIVDPSGQFLPQRLVLKRLQADRTWKDEQDPDGGVTSSLGFRVIWDADGKLRVVNLKTGRRYPRPNEAANLVDAAEKRICELESELRRSKKKPKPPSRKRKKNS